MEIKVFSENGRVPVTILHIDGDIDSSNYQTFQNKAEELIEAGARYFLIDLAHSKFVSSAGFRAINALYNKLRAIHPDENLSDEDVKKGISAGTYKSPHLKLINLSEDVMSTFEMAGFNLYIESFTDQKEAIASF